LLIALGTPVRGIPRPWQYFEVPALMVNAYEIIKNETLRREIQAKGGLHNFLDYDGIIFLDSGGFQAMRYNFDIKIKKLIEVYKMANADYYFSLDYPSINPGDEEERILRTIRNFKKLRKIIENVIPVVHPNTERAVREYEAYKEYDPEYIAIGGLVPLMLSTRGLSDGRKKSIDLMIKIRSMHNKSVHVMGLGSPTVIPILKIIGCTSTDSSAWRVKAAHGKIMLPNGGERYVSGRNAKFGVTPLSEEEITFISKLGCPVLKEYDFDELTKSFEVRALFNAWVTLHANSNNYEVNGPFGKLLGYAMLLMNRQINLNVFRNKLNEIGEI
jgi:tRNA-guanine family transglycosylase